uniref:ATP synthase F0 subunit 8 n=1 Tax=Gordionus wolterstorffii TaxID=190562 RepID=A0A514ABY2_9BILA|nr:ATP synthase F0 subunit 8 [Gordionus wolterstorffii]
MPHTFPTPLLALLFLYLFVFILSVTFYIFYLKPLKHELLYDK